jgi:hypothetical protein
MKRTEPAELANLGVLASITAAGLLLSGIAIVIADRGESYDQFAASSAQCQDADRGTVAQLVEILRRNRPGDSSILDRGIYGLSVARRHCLYSWNDIAGEQYDRLGRWLDEHK